MLGGVSEGNKHEEKREQANSVYETVCKNLWVWLIVEDLLPDVDIEKKDCITEKYFNHYIN